MKKDIMSYCGDEILDAADKNWNSAVNKSKSGRLAFIAATALIGAALIAVFAVAMSMRNSVTPPDTASVQPTVTNTDTDKNTEVTVTDAITDAVTTDKEDDNVRYDDSGFGLVFKKSKGSDSIYVVSGKSGGGADAEPPAFTFYSGGIVVKVKQKSVHDDTFAALSGGAKYRLISFDVLDVIRGKNVPETVLYLMPEYYFVDMSGYDCLYIALFQHGCEGFLMKDISTGELCEFREPVFITINDCPALGDVIAFNDGVFDESLWQNKNWIYGYQFGRYYLDNYADELVVERGCTEQYTVGKIKNRINDYPEEEPVVFYVKDAPSDLRSVFEYISQGTFKSVMYGKNIFYQRFINGCPTNESLYIWLGDNTVQYDSTAFTEADMDGLYNLGSEVERISARYKENIPDPPHFDPGEKKLLSLKVEGYYNKTDNGVLQFITTTWTYTSNNYNTYYYDEAFTVYENGEAREVSRKELSQLIGQEAGILGENYTYGEGVETPMC